MPRLVMTHELGWYVIHLLHQQGKLESCPLAVLLCGQTREKEREHVNAAAQRREWELLDRTNDHGEALE